jgi:hypothetical protein
VDRGTVEVPEGEDYFLILDCLLRGFNKRMLEFSFEPVISVL